MKLDINELARGYFKFGKYSWISVTYEFVVVAIENIFAFFLEKFLDGGNNAKKIRNNKERLCVFENKSLIEVATFNFLDVVADRK